MIFVTDIVAIS